MSALHDNDPSPATLGDTISVAPNEWTPIDDYGTEIYLYGDQPCTLVVRHGDNRPDLSIGGAA
jgi:hypothetical protein